MHPMSKEFTPTHPANAKRNAEIVTELMKKHREISEDIAMLNDIIADNALDVSAKEMRKKEQSKLFLLESILNPDN